MNVFEAVPEPHAVYCSVCQPHETGNYLFVFMQQLAQWTLILLESYRMVI